MRALTAFLIAIVLLACLTTCVYAEEYLIKAGDTLSITVVDETDLTRKVVVDSEGKITLPLIKEVEVAGLTTAQAAETLTAALKKFMKNPQLTLEIAETAKTHVSVSGEVGKPGVVIIAAGARLMEAITAAGGYSSNADLSKVSVTRSGGTDAVIVDLSAFLLGGQVSPNIELTDGDVIVVPAKALRTVGKVAVLGAVRQPGSYEITQGATVREAIMLAGGPTEVADLENCTIRRDGSASAVKIDYAKALQGDEVANQALKPGDVIYVGAAQQLGYYSIQGAVNAAGRYELKGKVTITEAIAIAGGVRDRAKLSDVRILRTTDQGTKTLLINVTDVMNGRAENVPIENQDSIYVAQAREKTNVLQWASVAISLLWLLTNSD